MFNKIVLLVNGGNLNTKPLDLLLIQRVSHLKHPEQVTYFCCSEIIVCLMGCLTLITIYPPCFYEKFN